MFIDPGLPKGVRLAWRLARSKPTNMNINNEDGGDLDFMSALNSTPLPETAPVRKKGLDRLRATRVRDSEASLKVEIPGTTSISWTDVDAVESKDSAEMLATENLPVEPVRGVPDHMEPVRTEAMRMQPMSGSRAAGRERKDRRERSAKAELEELAHRL